MNQVSYASLIRMRTSPFIFGYQMPKGACTAEKKVTLSTMQTGDPLDIHYLRLDSWLADREAVLSKRNRKAFTGLKALAPQLASLGNVEVPLLRKQILRERARCAEFTRRVEECDVKEISSNWALVYLLTDCGIFADCFPELKWATSRGGRGVYPAPNKEVFAAASRAGLHAPALVDARAAYVFWNVCNALEAFVDEALPVCFGAFDSFQRDSFALFEVSHPLCPPASPLSAASLFPHLARLMGSRGAERAADRPPSLATALKLAEEESRRCALADNAISWGANDAVQPEALLEESAVEIDWCIEENTGEPREDIGSDLLDPACDASVVQLCSSIASAVGSLEARCAITDELHSLRAFFSESAGDVLFDASSHSRLHTSPQVENSMTSLPRRQRHADFVSRIDALLSTLMDSRTLEFLRVGSDTSARNALLERLSRALSAVSQVDSRRREYVTEIEDSIEKASVCEASFADLSSKVKSLQARCEDELTSLCFPRQVLIAGDINDL